MDQKQYDELKTQLETTGKQIDEKVNAMNAKAEAGEKIGKDNTAELQKLVKSFGDMQKDVDEMAVAMKRGNGLGGESKLPADQLREALEKSADFADFRKKGKGRSIIELPELKATLLTGGIAPGLVVGPQRIPGIVAPNLRQTSVLDLLPTAPTTSNAFQYVRESSYTSNAAYVVEGELKPEDALALTEETGTVQTLATTLRISKQAMDDIPGLVGYITARAPRKLQYVKENAVLFGPGTSGTLEGITTVAAAFAPGADIVVQSPNRFDVLGAAALQATMAEYVASGAVLHTADLFLLRHAKSADGHYLFPELRDAGTIEGMQVAETRIAAMRGKFLVGDFALGAQLFQRQGLTIEFFDQDRDNVPRNLMTIRVEERHALAVYRPDAFVYGTFAAAITDLTS